MKKSALYVRWLRPFGKRKSITPTLPPSLPSTNAEALTNLLHTNYYQQLKALDDMLNEHFAEADTRNATTKKSS